MDRKDRAYFFILNLIGKPFIIRAHTVHLLFFILLCRNVIIELAADKRI